MNSSLSEGLSRVCIASCWNDSYAKQVCWTSLWSVCQAVIVIDVNSTNLLSSLLSVPLRIRQWRFAMACQWRRAHESNRMMDRHLSGWCGSLWTCLYEASYSIITLKLFCLWDKRFTLLIFFFLLDIRVLIRHIVVIQRVVHVSLHQWCLILNLNNPRYKHTYVNGVMGDGRQVSRITESGNEVVCLPGNYNQTYDCECFYMCLYSINKLSRLPLWP